MKIKDIPTLTGLRGFAAIWVCLHHYSYGKSDTLFQKLLSVGSWGVIFFFVLSGFIMAYVYQDWFKHWPSNREYLKFLQIRFARIYPLHALLLLTTALFIWYGYIIKGPNDTFYTFILNIFLMQSWGFTGTISWNDPSWSVSSEFFCYLLFPFLIAGLRLVPNKMQLAIIIISIFLVSLSSYWLQLLRLIFSLHVPTANTLQFDYGISLIYWLLSFLLGSALYIYIEKRKFTSRTSEMMIWMSAVMLMLAMWLFLFVSKGNLYRPFVYISSALLVGGLFVPTKIGDGLFANKLSIFLGNISYALYLSHTLLPNIFNGIFIKLGIEIWWSLLPLLLQLIIAIALATLLHNFFEKPIRSWLRSIFQSNKKVSYSYK